MPNKSLRILAGFVSSNNPQNARQLLQSLSELKNPNIVAAYVERHSSNVSFEVIKTLFPEVRAYQFREDFGYGEGVNVLIRMAKEEAAAYVLLLKNGAHPGADCINRMVEKAADSGVGVVFAGKTQPPLKSAAQTVAWTRRFSAMPFAALVSMEAIRQTGYLNPLYFKIYDDLEWFRRILYQGYEVRFLEEPLDAVLSETSEEDGYYFLRNTFYFLKESGECRSGVANLFIREAFRQILGDLVKGRLFPVYTQFLACWDALKGKRGAGRVRARLRPDPKQKALSQEIKPSSPRRILVELNWNIGDEIMAFPVFEGLKKKYPDAELGARVRYPELLKGNPFVDSVNPSGDFKEDWRLDLHSEDKAVPRMKYLQDLTGLEAWGLPRIYLAPGEAENVRNKFKIQAGRMLIGICPEAKWFSRRWPRENWTELVRYFQKNHSAEVFVLGKEGLPVPGALDLINQTTLREAAALLSLCRLFAGSDSGMLHLALAVQTPSVGLFGPLNPDDLLERRPHFVPVWSSIECRGCWSQDRMKYPDHCPITFSECMEKISVQDVIFASEALLKPMVSGTIKQ